jgi:MoxR-like ATPase
MNGINPAVYAMNKQQLIAICRACGLTVPGDYSRTPKGAYLSVLGSVEPDAIDKAVDLVLRSTAAQVPSFQSTALIAGAATAVAPTSAAPFAAPTYSHGVLRTESAEKAFGIKSTLLRGVQVEIWSDPDAPAVMPSFRFNPQRLLSVLSAIKRQRPVWCAGPAGTGKTEFVRQVCARLGRYFARVQFDASLEAYHVIGGERVRAGSTVWQDGLVLGAFRRPGAVILLDEVGFARSEYTSSLHAALEPNASITVPETGEVIRRAPGVTFLAADNSNGRGDQTGTYAGIREQNNAFLNRFASFIEFDFPSAEDEAAIVTDATGCQPLLAKLLVEFVGICRAKVESGAIEQPPSIRESMYLAEALTDGIPARRAFEEVIVNRAPIDTKEALQQLWAANVSVDAITAALRGEALVAPAPDSTLVDTLMKELG